MPVSYLHPPDEGPLRCEVETLLASERAVGECSLFGLVGEGDRALKENLLGRCEGVDGTEIE